MRKRSFSSFEKDQKLFENWRRFAEGTDDEEGVVLGSAVEDSVNEMMDDPDTPQTDPDLQPEDMPEVQENNSPMRNIINKVLQERNLQLEAKTIDTIEEWIGSRLKAKTVKEGFGFRSGGIASRMAAGAKGLAAKANVFGQGSAADRQKQAKLKSIIGGRLKDLEKMKKELINDLEKLDLRDSSNTALTAVLNALESSQKSLKRLVGDPAQAPGPERQGQGELDRQADMRKKQKDCEEGGGTWNADKEKCVGGTTPEETGTPAASPEAARDEITANAEAAEQQRERRRATRERMRQKRKCIADGGTWSGRGATAKCDMPDDDQTVAAPTA